MALTAANTMGQLQKQLDIISNNVANVNTNGYKKQNATFSELMYQRFNNIHEAAEVDRTLPVGIGLGTGAKIDKTTTDSTLGNVKATDRSLDFFLTAPKQYFKVLDGSDVQYTRDGAFYLTPMNETEAALVTSNGHQVLDENNNPIIFNGDLKTITMSGNGELTFSNETGTSETFALGVAMFSNPESIVNLGNNLVTARSGVTDAGRDQIGIKQGALEQSNVDLAEEMTKLIQTQRAYQFQAKSITMADQMRGLVNSIR